MPLLSLKELDKLAWGWTEFTDPASISDDNIIAAYRLQENYCQNKSCRRNCRGNPFCLTGLGETKLLDSIQNPEDDTNITLPKRSEGQFVGLKNLGATCYVNSLLQLLFHNKTFRETIFLWNPLEDPVERDNLSTADVTVPLTVIGHLQQLFALMLHSKCAYIDPSPLVESLRLDTCTQQDAQEFSKLFISLLESTLIHQSLPNVRNLIGDIFRGEYMYVTRCCQCLTESVSPSTFDELVLNVRGNHSLTECLTEFLQEEKLEGQNSYSCAKCQSKQAACRFIKLRSLPPVLNFQLLRFVYDREKGQRKKLKTVIQFPEVLDMKEFLSSDSEIPLIYNLSAVLIHKGSRAFSGHFVAYIKDSETGTWNTFNDEQVEKLDGKKLKIDNYDDFDNPSKTKVPRAPKGFQSSTDAYMLVYTLDKHNPNVIEVPLPERLLNYVDSQNKTFNEICEHMACNQKEGIEKQEEMFYLHKSLSVDNVEDLENIDVLPLDWLTSWLDWKKEYSAQIDNSKVLCPHARLDPKLIASVKYVNSAAANTLYDQFKGGPRLSGHEILCKSCVSNTCLVSRMRTKSLEDSKEITALLKKRIGVDDPGYYVSKYCLKTWRTRVMNQLEGRDNQSRESCSQDKPTSESTLPTLTSTCLKISDQEETNECKLVPARKRLLINNNSTVIPNRKLTQKVLVPISEIKYSYKLCYKLQLSLKKTLNQFDKETALDLNTKLMLSLKRLAFSTERVKAHRGLLRRKCNLVNTNSAVNNNCTVECSHVSEGIVIKDNCVDMVDEVSTTQEEKCEGIKEEISEVCDNRVKTKSEDDDNNIDDEGEASKEFNEVLKCIHGNLSIEESVRKLVPTRVWEILKQYFPSAPEFSNNTPPCHQCQNLASKDEFVKQQYYDNALTQKRLLADLFHLRNRPQIGKTDGTIYLLSKQDFYQPWINFIRAASRRDGVGMLDPPTSLHTESLLCVHGRLNYNPQLEEDLVRLVLVTSPEWEALLTIFTTSSEVTVAPSWITFPQLCTTCIMTRLEKEQQEKLTYDRAKVNIRMVSSVTLVDDDQENAKKKIRLENETLPIIQLELKTDVRRSARNRKIPGQKDVSFFVSSTLTLRELKQKITGQLAVAPFDQHLFTQDGKELMGDFNTLSSLGILPNTTLLLQVDEAKESFDDVMEECSSSNEPEVGFKGTGLLRSH